MRDPWAEDIEVVSSENVAFGVESAGLGSRFAATCIDLAIQGLVLGLGVAVVSWSLDLAQVDKWSPALHNIAQAIGVLVTFCILWGYYFAFEWRWDGQTPGKRALGLRVLHTDGSPLTMWGALVRNLLRIFDFLPGFYGAGALVALLGPNNRRMGDLVANTIVARQNHDATRQVLSIGQAAEAFLSSAQNPLPDSVAAATSSVAAPTNIMAPTVERLEAESNEFEAAPDLETLALRARLKAADWEMALDFARRREGLAADVRTRLAARLAQQLAAKAGVEPGADAEAFVMRVASEASRRTARV